MTRGLSPRLWSNSLCASAQLGDPVAVCRTYILCMFYPVYLQMTCDKWYGSC